MFEEIILIKTGELALKGLNRGTFEDALLKNLRYRLRGAGDFQIRRAQSAIYAEPQNAGCDLDEACARVARVFGISAYSRAAVTEKDLAVIRQTAAAYLKEQFQKAKSFKVEAKRSDKNFPLTSPELCREVGGYLSDAFPRTAVDVHNPELTVTVEIRDFGAYIHGAQLPGAGGMPVGTGGKAGLLISGGIDSPVAGYRMARRGVELVGIHFASPPYTSERAELKVRELLEKVSCYAGRIPLCVVPFTHIQEEIRDNCPEELFTLVMRRFMMKIASVIAEKEGCEALVTGESVGQVASQTLPALRCTEEAARLPVLRPLIGMDKEEIVETARKIDTFDISIQPYEDCCTVFTPRHPRTRPKLPMLLEAEAKLDVTGLVNEAVAGVTTNA